MPARGHIGDSGILRELMQTLGPSASKDETCRTLQQWYNQARRERNNKRAQRIKKTQKALNCRKHR